MKDNINPKGKWEFDGKVTTVFSDMIQRSIPDYTGMRNLCDRIGRNYIQDGDLVVDIGCSNGLATESLIKKFPRARFMLLDVSMPMLQSCKERYAEEITKGRVDVLYADLRDGLPFTYASLVISSLTIQFTPIEYRQKILKGIFNSLRPGGGFVFIEKVIGNTADIDDLLIKEYYDMKRENGYEESLIQNKRKSLEGVLVPLTAEFNEKMLRNSGFQKVDCFWRCLNFSGWIAVK